MTRRAVFLRFLVALAVTWWIVVILYPWVYRAVAAEPSSWAPLAESRFADVPAPRSAATTSPGLRVDLSAGLGSVVMAGGTAGVAPHPISLGGGVNYGASSVYATTPVPKRAPKPAPRLRGIASWYQSPGLQAAVPSWRWGMVPYRVRVCAERCVEVWVRGYCRCRQGRDGHRIIDLSPMAFRALGVPLSRGVLRVEVAR